MKKFSKVYIALILAFLFAPIAVLIVFSFNAGKSTSVMTGFSFKWYLELFKNSEVLNALKNSLILAISSSAIATVMGTAAAFGIHHMRKKWLKNSVMTATNIPMMNPEIITGISLMFLFVFVGTHLGLATKLNFWTMLIAHVTVNIIHDSAIVDKQKLTLPKSMKNVLKCVNPRCITSIEQELQQIFTLTDETKQIYRCRYCDEKYK